MKTTGKYSIKPYQCIRCGKEEEHGTNHWGEIYPFCSVCREYTVWTCLEEMPEGYEKPKTWNKVRLGDIANIT